MWIAIFGLAAAFPYLLSKFYALLSKKELQIGPYLIYLGIIGLAFATACINPPADFDLYRHYGVIDNIRAFGWDYAFDSSRYSNLPVITFLFFLVSLTPWDGTLVFIAVLINLLIFESINKYYAERNCGSQIRSIGFFLYLSLNDVILMVSGIRNVLAVALVGYAIWRWENQRSSSIPGKLLVLLCAIIPIGIHPACAIVLLIYVVSRIPNLYVAIAISLGWMFLFSYAVGEIGTTGIPVIDTALNSFRQYSENDFSMRRLSALFSPLLVVLFSAILLFWRGAGSGDKKPEITRYDKFAIVYSFAVIGAFGLQVVTMRMLYGLGIIYFHALMRAELRPRPVQVIMAIAALLYSAVLLWYQISCLLVGFGLS